METGNALPGGTLALVCTNATPERAESVGAFTRGLSRLEPGQAPGSRAYRSSQVALVPRSDWSRLIRGEVVLGPASGSASFIAFRFVPRSF